MLLLGLDTVLRKIIKLCLGPILVSIDFFVALKIFMEGVLWPLDLTIMCGALILVKVIKLIQITG